MSLVLDMTLSLHSLCYHDWGHQQKGDPDTSKELFSVSSIYRWPLWPDPAWHDLHSAKPELWAIPNQQLAVPWARAVSCASCSAKALLPGREKEKATCPVYAHTGTEFGATVSTST